MRFYDNEMLAILPGIQNNRYNPVIIYFGHFMAVTTRYSFWEFSGNEKNISIKK